MDLHWIDPTLAVASRPRGGDWLDDDLKALKRDGVDVLVSCLEPDEESELGLNGEADAARQAGLTFLAAPIVDRGTPDDMSAFTGLLDELMLARADGRQIAVHCRQGLGRGPLVAATLLVRSGMLADEAWRQVAEGRGVPVPETAEQREWLDRFAASMSVDDDHSRNDG